MSYEIRRLVTGHDADGKAVVREDRVLESHEVADGYDALEIWCTSALPASNNDDDASTSGQPGDKGTRALIRFGELAPGHRSPMHRSQSLDYGLLLRGECELHLDGGDVRELKAPCVVVQRGTNHAWVVATAEPALFAWILIDAEPVEVGDRELPEAMPAGHDVLSDFRTD